MPGILIDNEITITIAITKEKNKKSQPSGIPGVLTDTSMFK